MNLTPKFAAILSLIVPGAAHVALGRPLRAVLAALTTIGLFFIGWSVLGERLWFFALFEPFDFLAIPFKLVPLNLLPEGLNVGSTALAGFLRDAESFSRTRLSRMEVPGEDWASMLTGLSGVLSALWAADAHWLAKGPRAAAAKVQPALAAMASWMIPGAGHWMAGQKDKGVLLGVCVLFVFVLGLLVSGGHAVNREHYGPWWIVDSTFGAGTVFASLVTAPLDVTVVVPLQDFGLAICATAGLMNVMVITDSYTVCETLALGAEDEPQEATT